MFVGLQQFNFKTAQVAG